MAEFCASDICKLAELLKDPYEDDFQDDQVVKNTKKFAPYEKAKPKIVKSADESNDDAAPTTSARTKETIEDLESKLLDESESCDWRKTPRWNLTYKQTVTPSDVYLQMSGKTQLTSSCEDMIITIELPGEKSPGIDVKVTKHNLNVLSANHRLTIPLPQPVDPQQGNAKWDPNCETLILTLKMNREYDYINF